MVWNKILGLFKLPRSPRVVVSGLKNENRVFQDSINSEANAFLGKATHLLSDVSGVTIHVKSSGKGKASKFELHALLSASDADFHAQANGRELNFVLNDLFNELLFEARKHKSMRDKRKKHREKFFAEVDVK